MPNFAATSPRKAHQRSVMAAQMGPALVLSWHAHGFGQESPAKWKTLTTEASVCP